MRPASSRRQRTVSATSRRVSCCASSCASRSSSSLTVKCSPRRSRTQVAACPSLWSCWAKLRNTSASSVLGPMVPGVVNGGGASIVTPPCASTRPERKPIDERWPSPICRTLITKRSAPGGVPDWSGAATTEGLHNAAASTAYSWVNVAPSSNHCSSDSAVPGARRLPMRSALWRKVVARSRWRPSKRCMIESSVAVTSPSSRARMRRDHTGRSPFGADRHVVSRHEELHDHA